jgi:HK97 family phage major capsid protein
MFREDIALQERTRHVEAFRSIVDKADAAKRALSRRENAEIRELEVKIETLDEQIKTYRAGGDPTSDGRSDGPFGGSFDLHAARRRAAAHGIGRDEDGDGVALTRSQSMSDWYSARHGGGFGTAGDGLKDDGEANIGSFVRALVAGDRSTLNNTERRALSEGVDATGGFLVPEILSVKMIDRVRAAARVFQAGAQTVPMTVDVLNLARLTGGASASWKTEGAAVAESAMTFDRVVLKTKTLPVMVKLSQELFDDMSPEASNLIQHEIASTLALELDRAVLRGSGVDPEPKGILNQTGVIKTSLGANGATPSYDAFLDGFQVLRAANFEPDGIIYSPRTERTLDGLKDTQGRYLEGPASFKAIPKWSTNQLPTNLVTGTSNDTSEAYLGAWTNCLVGLRTELGMRVKVLDQRFADNLQVGLLCWIRADVALAHAEAFTVIQGIRP